MGIRNEFPVRTTDLMKKGLRRIIPMIPDINNVRTTDLMKKGLRLD